MERVTKTREQVKDEFIRKGQTVEGWARSHGFTAQAVRRVIDGKTVGRYGNGHKIAVMLGLKDGEIVEESQP